ncbi:MAG: type II and III secretion system protein family protein [Pseudomonadota bacterium]
MIPLGPLSETRTPATIIASAHATDNALRRSRLEPRHRAIIRIPEGTTYPIVRKIKVGLDKSLLIELPVDLKDVLVSNPEVVDAVVQSSKQVYLLAKDVGEANAFFMGPNGEKLLYLDISVTRDLSALRDMLERMIPGARVKAEAMGASVVLTGSVATPADANRAAQLAGQFIKKPKGVVNLLKVDAKDQVLLKVTVAEIQRDALRRLGVQLPGARVNAANLTFTKVIQNAFPITSGAVPATVATGPGALPFVAAGNALQGTFARGNQSVSALIEALERTGVFKTLAEPSLAAISGETAKFLAGGEFPIPVQGDDNKVTVEFKEFGIGVTFKPVVLSGGRISLKISAEVSELSNEGAVTVNQIAIPGLKVRRAETVLELVSGGTLAMAGLLSEDTRRGVEGVPGLKSIPILGALFRSNDYRRRETELVILVTPYIANNGIAKHRLAKPGRGFMPAAELDAIFRGHINRIYGHPVKGRPGDHGFVIEYPALEARG